MVKRIRKFCPHCAKAYKEFWACRSPRHYGSPFRTCDNCKKQFVDRDYLEPSFVQKPRLVSLRQAAQRYFNPYGMVALVALFVAALRRGAVVQVLSLLPTAWYLFLVLRLYFRRRSMLQQQLLTYELSQRRTRKPDYIKRLLDHGCKVPPEFLEKHHPALLDYNPRGTALPECKVRTE